MFGPYYKTSSLSITKVLSGLKKGLQIAKEAIPLYKEIKPMVNNARNILSIAKEINSPNIKKKTITIPEKKEETNHSSSINPTFFQ